MTPEREELLRRLALNDIATLEATLGAELARPASCGLDARTHALVRVAALVATDSQITSYLWAVESALASGASDDDVVDVLVATAAIVGLARLCGAAPMVGSALGYDTNPD